MFKARDFSRWPFIAGRSLDGKACVSYNFFALMPHCG